MNTPVICFCSGPTDTISKLMVGMGKAIDLAFRRDREEPRLPNPRVLLVRNPQDIWSRAVSIGIAPGDYAFTVGDNDPDDQDTAQLAVLQQTNPVFHIMVGEGRHASTYPKQVRSRWEAILGANAIWLDDHKRLGEIVIATVRAHKP